MAAFTEAELALAIAIHQAARSFNGLVKEARDIGLDVALRLGDSLEEFVGPGGIQSLPSPCDGNTLEVMVYKVIIVEAASADAESEPPDAVIPHGWMG